MLLYHINYVEYICIGFLLISLLIGLCVVYAYSIDSQRSEEDSQKKNYPPGAVFFALFTWPIFLIAFISLLVLRALFYALFLIIFIASLFIVPPQYSEPTWLERMAARIGTKLLDANTLLIKLFFRPWARESETI